MRSGLRKAGLILFGYLVAVVAAVVVAEALMLAPTALPDGGASGSLVASLRDLPAMLAIGFFWTFPCALPGFLVAVALAAWLRWRRWLPYSLAGAVNALPSLMIFADSVGGGPFDIQGMLLPCAPGGFAGGFAYWASAGRLVRRREVAAA